MAIVRADSAKPAQLSSFSGMSMGVIAVVVDPCGEYNNVLVMKVRDGGSGTVIKLDGLGMWSGINSNPLRVRILSKEELVTLSNE